MADFRAYDALVEERLDAYLAELACLCRQPSVSKSGEGIRAMADLVVSTAERHGAHAELLEPTADYPAVFALLRGGSRTLLLYDHYDVQPADPLEAWETPPWEPLLRDGKLFGRGVGDDKGELLARLQALEVYREAFGTLPLTVKFLVEGAHEIGSRGLDGIVTRHRRRLRADACLSEGLGRDEAGNFALYLGCRGFALIELRVRLRTQVLASMHGGLLPNPALRLSQALMTLFDADGLLTLDGQAEQVDPPSFADLTMLAEIPWDEGALVAELGTERFLGGARGQALLRRYVLEPYATICTFIAGDPSWGLMLPAEATARVDLRLVPRLTPPIALELVRAHLARRGFDDVAVELLAGVAPDRTSADTPLAVAARAAARDLTDAEPVLYPLMAAYSAASVFHERLGTPVLFAGAVTYAGSNLHGPNEHIRVADYLEYLKYFGRLIARFAEGAPD